MCWALIAKSCLEVREITRVWTCSCRASCIEDEGVSLVLHEVPFCSREHRFSVHATNQLVFDERHDIQLFRHPFFSLVKHYADVLLLSLKQPPTCAELGGFALLDVGQRTIVSCLSPFLTGEIEDPWYQKAVETTPCQCWCNAYHEAHHQFQCIVETTHVAHHIPKRVNSPSLLYFIRMHEKLVRLYILW